MSHTVKLKTQLTCLESIKRACNRLGNVTVLGPGTVKFYSGKAAQGLQIKLPAWRYPIVVDIESGDVTFDNYNEHWGKQEELDKFNQAYGVEKAKYEGERNGYAITETVMTTGEIKVTLATGDNAGIDTDADDPTAGGYGIAGPPE